MGGQVTLTENVTLKGDYVSVRVEGNITPGAGNPATSAVFNMTGGTVADGIVVVGNGGKLDLSGGSVTSEDYAPISGNGRNDTSSITAEPRSSSAVLSLLNEMICGNLSSSGWYTKLKIMQVIGTNGVEMRDGDFM